MSFEVPKNDVFKNAMSKLNGHPFYILEDKIEQPTTESLTSYIENNFNSLFNYGLNIRRVGTLDQSGAAVVIADKHDANGLYCSYILFGYGNDLKARRCINGTWYNAN